MKTLRAKILLGFGASLFLVAVILILAIILLLRLGRASDAILQENYVSTLAAENMINDIERQDSGVLLVLLNFKEMGFKEFRESEVSFLQWLGRAKDNITIPGEKEVVEAIEKNYTLYLQDISQLQLGSNSNLNQTISIYYDKVLPRFRTIRDTCIKLRNLNHEVMYAASKQARQLAEQAVLFISLIGGVTIIGGLSFSLLLAHFITRPVTELKNAVLNLAQGDYTVQVPVRGEGELALLAEAFNVMAEKLRHFHEMDIDQILVEKRKSEAIIRSVDDGLVVVDENLLITNINPKAKAVFQVEDEEAQGKHVLEVVRDDRIFQGIKYSLETGQSPRIEEGEDILTIQHGEQAQHFQTAVLPMRSRAGGIPGAILVLRDVTRLKELDRLKSEFVMTASHELRTPLTSIGMSVIMLKESAAAKLTDQEREYLEVCHEEINRLKALVNDLLDLAKIEAGKLELNVEKVAPDFLARQASTIIKNQAEVKSITLTVELPADLPEVLADANKIVWVLVNLLANAVRYTAQGGHVWLQGEKVGEMVHFRVQDNGPGIPRELQSRIFDKFVRMDQGEATSGSGLGLAISKEIIRAHRGIIWLESLPGQGSTFTFTLPLSR
jgi:NtrC-family two-component system sensor histidine kinase KinB